MPGARKKQKKGFLMSEKIKVAVIAAGMRSQMVVKNLLRDSGGNVEVASVYDPDREVAEKALKYWESPDTRICASYEEAIAEPGVTWVMVFSPNARHCEHVLAAFAAGKHVFSEKPMATSIEDCVRIRDAHAAHPELFFATGFVLRYSLLYRRAKELLTSGEYGRILSVEANENIAPEHGGYIMCNWRRHKSEAGPHILEKCCHDLDLLIWLTESRPLRVSAFGARRFFRNENDFLMEKYGEKTFVSWSDPHGLKDPFTADSDLIDTQISAAEFENGVFVQFAASMSNAVPERRMRFNCSEGTVTLELYRMTLTCRKLGETTENTLRFTGDGHAGGDDFIMKELYETMSRGVPVKCSGREGLESAVYALAIDQAMTERRIVDLGPVWEKLDR